jgi:hypothetical protein
VTLVTHVTDEAYGGDWEGFYMNDALADEGHSLDVGQVLQRLNGHTLHVAPSLVVRTTEQWDSMAGHLPDKLSVLKEALR